MKVKTDIKDFKINTGAMERVISWKCDKCGEIGSTWIISNEAEDLDNKKHCEE